VPNKLVDLTGQTFGRLTVAGRAAENDPYRKARWDCICSCGGSVTVRSYDLRSGNTVSCGCYKYEATRKADHEIDYDAAHDRVEVAKGPARTHACVDCLRDAQDWSLRHDAPVTYLGSNGCRFSARPDDYEPRCKKCHGAYDHPRAA
jgi:hypothetical protein